MTHTVLIALGTNIGNRRANLRVAIAALSPKITFIAESAVYETEPWGYIDQPAFLNMVIRAQTDLSPRDLLDHLKSLESTLGRIPTFRNGPRVIDLDILFYDDLVLEMPSLVIPHPRLHERAFVLVPLADVASDWMHPLLGQSVAQLLETVDRRGVVQKPEDEL
jgi:2-amino-4-hydroxy-6-hydroxymethyldihydropteridine diphosphokinase